MNALVLGAGGFIGSHMVKALKSKGYNVIGVDLKLPEFSNSEADLFIIDDLRDVRTFNRIFNKGYEFDLVFQFAADMGGAGYIFTGDHDADVMHNSATINLNLLDALVKNKFSGRVFYSSSACMYPQEIQQSDWNAGLKESDAYPGNPDSEYGWEKLFSERLYLSYKRNYGIDVCIARFHNIFGPEGTYDGGKEKFPAAICRKIALAEDGDQIEIWGDGEQTRSFLYIDECIEGVLRLVESGESGPVNIGSSQSISINDAAYLVIYYSGKHLSLKHIQGPQGVRGRNSDNTYCRELLNWRPTKSLEIGLHKLYDWIKEQVKK